MAHGVVLDIHEVGREGGALRVDAKKSPSVRLSVHRDGLGPPAGT